MNISKKTGRVLGFAFLLQFITSFSSGVFLKSAWFVPEDMSATMLNIATNPGLMRANIFVDMLTALGVIFLGVMLFLTLRKQSEKIGLTALGFYLLEGTNRSAFALIAYISLISRVIPMNNFAIFIIKR